MVDLKKDVWAIADTLRGVYARNEAGDVILPMTILRRLECVMAPQRAQVAEIVAKQPNETLRVKMIKSVTGGVKFYNTTNHTLASVYDSGNDMVENLLEYVRGFSDDIDVFTNFDLPRHVDRMKKGGILTTIVRQFRDLDLSPEAVPNSKMGELFEHLIYMDFESSNAESGDHYTPRDAINLLVDLLFAEDDSGLSGEAIRSIYDPTVGTGGMLSVAEEHLHRMNPDAELLLYGQELRSESYALCRSDMLAKGQNPQNIVLGNTLTKDKFPDQRFNYILSNPPYGVDWKNDADIVEQEHKKGFGGRFGAGLPPTSDGALLFVQHAIAKMNPADSEDGGARAGIVLNGSPLFSGGAGSGSSAIRGWLLENDLVEAIVALPNDMFYNTGIATYLWIFDNAKRPERMGKVQLVDATALGVKMRKSVGSKRVEIGEVARERVLHQYANMECSDTSKILDNLDFAFWQITVERPLRLNFETTPERVALVAENKALGNIDGLINALKSFNGGHYLNREDFLNDLGKHLGSCSISLTSAQRKALWQTLGERDESADKCHFQTGKNKGEPEPDIPLRDIETVPFGWDGNPKSHDAKDATIKAYFSKEVKPHFDDAWVDHTKTKVGYEIPFTRHFYKYVPPRTLSEIDADLDLSLQEILGLLHKVEESK
ncbi:type I restriction enzyme M protein [Streptomyces sp. ScaeMP-e48]|uniref:type I restriction-modification system subunit M n=1 Tax=Streptomyces sp. ScaeMP-e48 TaxID=1100823 RepID=UPI00082383EC|nr:class I SAM-dependent DNA methyltransferase [Streptomyces sp. ScaeMP-e48]SCK52220.1 type I restriction enzyme M protein [Streptomyces sp. ScaeMP-e48]